MQGKVIVITGATSGIGEVAAHELARQGARLVVVARDAARATRLLSALKRAGPDQAHRAVLGDLAVLADMKRIGAEIAASEPRIDVLINNAGALFDKRMETVDGLERTFALNHMSYFVLTDALLPALKATPGARIVSTSSSAHAAGRVDFNDLQGARSVASFSAYGNSKLCNILFTRELARRLAGSGVTANCHHPGFVATRFGQSGGWLARGALKLLSPGALSPKQGAETLLYLATSPDVARTSGLYFVRGKEAATAPAAQDDVAAARLWEESVRIAA